MRVGSFFLILVFYCISLNASERHIALLVKHDFSGENAFAHRIKSACKNIYWKADIIYILDSEKLKKRKYDFVINLSPGTYVHPKCKNYLAIFHPIHHYFTEEGFLTEDYRSYDGYLLSYSPISAPNKDFADKKRFPYLRWYPTVQWQKYQKVVPSKIFHICCPWGNRFTDAKFQELLRLLDKEPYVRFYGNPLFQPLYNSYKGEIPYDGTSLREISGKAGITLVLHSTEHNSYGVPSGRIFEAAAASTVIICDQNPFVQKNFGDSVLYIDTDRDASSMYNQIQSHMEWIKKNKGAALKMAKKAHKIYKDKFLLENQLLRLEKFHELLSSNW